ncbi:AsmA family protein [Pedobacter lusitanus]|uniref:AsmA family protein n=1 Tax=Pedobacter lusitanus TaxID=1503925 RepID=A0A0D0GN74_9SPHI|nr:AsmA family protein [Pedobacter lusitanus]KIO77640.1 AsmA family protein [Pedobacter lusitanus]
MPLWLKRSVQILASLILLIIVIFIGLAIYVGAHKKELQASITKQLNKNLNGSLTVGSLEPTFLKSFPNVSVALKKVEIKDSLWNVHHHSLLTATGFDIAVNTMALLKGTIEIRKVTINDAEVYLYTDSNGYSNTSVFKKKPEKAPVVKDDSSTPAEIRRFELNDVRFILDNRKGNKLFLFAIQDFNGKVDYPSSGWNADIKLKTLVRSLAFNTKRGSFVKDKVLEGKMNIAYNEKAGMIEVKPNVLNIGSDPFVLGAKFKISKDPVEFSISVEAPHILWKNASALLAPNITSKLDMFSLDKPIYAKAVIEGNMGAGGDPSIFVKAKVNDNVLTGFGGIVEQCNFSGIYTNNFINGKGFTDANSAIKLYHFSGSYKELPFTADTVFIHNLDKPVATGIFKSRFDVAKLSNVLGKDVLNFTKGTADLKLQYSADIVDFRFNKPMLAGLISVKNADVSYVPRGVDFKNTSIMLDFKGPDLLIRDIRLQSGKSVVYMDGSIKNFLNLYYNDPEKILVNWKMHSPEIYLGEFLGFLGDRKSSPPVKSKSKSNSFATQINTILDKGSAEINLRVDKVHYSRFTGTNATADIFLSHNGLSLKNVSLKHGGGAIKLDGKLKQNGRLNSFALNTVVSNVNIRDFFYSFENFGLQSPTSKNLRGNFSARTNVTGSVNGAGKLIPGSMNGNVSFVIKKGALVSFDAVKNIGRFAFPFRNLDNITFDNLNGKFDINGRLVTIRPMMINSSVLNMDLAGVYATTGKGTNILLDVPLRNPKKDEDITDKQEIKERRMKGIVIHVLATDGEDGKIKFKLVGKKDKES